MDWRDPEGLWQRGMKARRRRPMVVLGLLLLSLALPWAFFAGLLPIAFGAWPLLWVVHLSVAGTFALIVGVWVARRIMRDAELVHLVPRHGGRVCPKCAKPIEPGDDDAQLTCPRCGGSFTADELHNHWRRYGISPIEPYRWIRGQNREGVIEDGSIQLVIDERRARRGAMQAIVVLLCGTTLFVLLSCTFLNARSGLVAFLPPFLIVIGFSLFGFAWRAVDVDRRFCAVCRYEREADAGEYCPECGSAWREDGGTFAGRLVPRPGVFVAGGLILVLGAVILLGMFSGTNLVARATPTSYILNRIAATQDPDNYMQWQSLVGRTLTEEQRRTLIEHLLAKRDADALTVTDGQWLAGQYLAATMPSDLADEYHRGMMEIDLVAPDRIAVGETFEVTIRTNDRFSVTGTQFPTTIVSGFFVDDDPEPRARPPIAIPALMLGHERFTNGAPDQAFPASYRPHLTLTPDRPGEVRVRLELWLIAMPSVDGTSFIVQWNDDGAPVLPARHDWIEHKVIERAIEVVEAP